MEHGLELLDPAQRLTRLETQMSGIVGNGQPGALHELRRWVIWAVVLSAMALGTRIFDIAQAFLKH